MKRELRHIFALAACALCLSCSKGREEGAAGLVPVRFSAAADTKAGGTLIDNDDTAYIPSGTSFALYGWTGTDVNGSPDYMFNQQVHNDGGAAEGSFSYAPTKYWPNDGSALSFVAVWPYGAEGLSFNASPSGPTFSYSVAPDAASQADLLVSRVVTASLSGDDRVGLAFRHALSRVLVQISVDAAFGNNGTLAVIDGVSLLDVKSSGTYDPASGGWSSLSSPVDYSCGLSGGTSDVLLLLPQAAGDIRFRVDYTVHILDGEGRSVSHSSHSTYAAPASSGGTLWSPGTKYSYQLVLKETHLEVTSSVLPWDVEEKTYDYSTEVTIADDGLFSWTSGTYASASVSTWKVITAFNTDLTGSFCIETPEGAVWYAILETLSGAAESFRCVDEEGNVAASSHGPGGERSTIRIRQTDLYPAETNSAKLSFVVRSAGRNIPVEAIVDAQGHSWTIIQNANN